jgi:hypothetical protein
MKLKLRYNIQTQKSGPERGCANQDHLPASELERLPADALPLLDHHQHPQHANICSKVNATNREIP